MKLLIKLSFVFLGVLTVIQLLFNIKSMGCFVVHLLDIFIYPSFMLDFLKCVPIIESKLLFYPCKKRLVLLL